MSSKAFDRLELAIFTKIIFALYITLLYIVMSISIFNLCTGEFSTQEGLNRTLSIGNINRNNFSSSPLALNDYNPVAGIEDLLRNQSSLTSTFEDLLRRTPTTIVQKIDFLNGFEDLIRRQSELIFEFDFILERDWNSISGEQQIAFLCSFEDLIWREASLIEGFYNLSMEDWPKYDSKNQTKLLDSYEELLRRQSNLIKSYKDLYKKVHGGISIEKNVDKIAVHSGDTVEYTYEIANWYSNKSLKNIYITDNIVGLIASNVTLRPMETKSFRRYAVISVDTCNKAEVFGKDFANQVVTDESNFICVKVIRMGKNSDSIEIGNQISKTFGSMHPKSSNNLEIKKNQWISRNGLYETYNEERIVIRDQFACSYSAGSSNNYIDIETNQY